MFPSVHYILLIDSFDSYLIMFELSSVSIEKLFPASMGLTKTSIVKPN